MRKPTAWARLAVLLAISLSWLGSALAAAPVYTIQGFAIGNGSLTTFEAVNASGVVLGDLANGLKGTLDQGVVTPLPQSTRGFPATAFINEAGEVAMFRSSRSAPHGSIALLYTQGERIRLFKMGGTKGINAKGQVVGVSSSFAHPVIYENGSYRRLRTLNDQSALPEGINDDGVVVGLNYDGSKYRPTLWDADGHPHFLGSVAKAGYGTARGVNNSSQVVGCTDVLGCYLYEAGQFTTLPPAGGKAWSDVRGISQGGIALGYTGSPAGDLVYCKGQTYLLQDLIAGDEHGRWELYAWAIGPAGHIVGSGRRDGVVMTFLATLASDCSAD